MQGAGPLNRRGCGRGLPRVGETVPVLLLQSGGSFAFSILGCIYRSIGPSPGNFYLSSKFSPVSETCCPKLGSTIAQGCQNVQYPEGPP